MLLPPVPSERHRAHIGMTLSQLWHEPRIHVQAAPDSVSSRILKLGFSPSSPEGAFIAYSASFCLVLGYVRSPLSALSSVPTWRDHRTVLQVNFLLLLISSKLWPKLTKIWPKTWPKTCPKTWPKLDRNLNKTWPKLSALGFEQHSLDSRTALQVNFLLLLWNRILTSWPNSVKSAALGLLKWRSLLIIRLPTSHLLPRSFFACTIFSFSVVVPWAKCRTRWEALFPNVKALTHQTRFARPRVRLLLAKLHQGAT